MRGRSRRSRRRSFLSVSPRKRRQSRRANSANSGSSASRMPPRKKASRQTFVDEENRNYMAGVFAVDVADAAILKASADVKEKESAIRVAEADVKLKISLVEVARRDRDHTRALMDFAQITAPFDGVIVDRKVQPGTLVQDASTGFSQPLLTIARTDIVTLVMKVPDDTAPYVRQGTEAEITIDSLHGVVIHGKVTRFSRRSSIRIGRGASRSICTMTHGSSSTPWQRLVSAPGSLRWQRPILSRH